jgi:hypothetical protein
MIHRFIILAIISSALSTTACETLFNISTSMILGENVNVSNIREEKRAGMQVRGKQFEDIFNAKEGNIPFDVTVQTDSVEFVFRSEYSAIKTGR